MKKLSAIFLIFFFSFLTAQNDPHKIRYRSPNYTDTSVLSSGDIYKIEIKKDGVYKINSDYLKNLGIDISNLDPKNIKIYGNGGGSLNQVIDDNFIDDLLETPIFIEGESDGKFDNNDYILFYAEGANKWSFNTDTKLWEFKKNIYSNSNYYFIKISDEAGKRVSEVTLEENSTYLSEDLDGFAVYEDDMINLLGAFIKTEGSGQEWYGESVSGSSEKDFSKYFSDFSFIKEKPVDLKLIFAGRNGTTSSVEVIANNESWSNNISSASLDNPESTYAYKSVFNKTYVPGEDKIKIKIKYNGEKGWLDKIQFNSRVKPEFSGSQMILTDKNAPANSIATFNLTNVNENVLVWDISSPDNIANYNINMNNNIAEIKYNTSTSKKFIAFSKNGTFLTPGEYKKIDNQNLHSILDADMLVVYPKEFEESALKFSDYRAGRNNIKVYAVELEKIFNEFSCGKLDPTAIRDFVRMLKIKNDNFKYLLLFGDGSFDARGIMTDKDNHIPVYETKNSLSPIDAFPSDDYFGLISYGEGGNLNGTLDISIGRIPVNTNQQAEIFVQKIIDYENDINYFGDWVNNISLSADDVDEDWDIAHFNGAEKIYENLDKKYSIFNINKIYLDAYIQENNAGGQRYPDANRAINSSFFKGQLIYVYVGHGGPKGLAQERVLQKDDILNWNNKYKLPLLITATCSFTGFDDPGVNTAGEEAFLKEKGGLIGLFSTVRAVYSSSNDALMKSTFNAFFDNEESKHLPLGDIIRISKNKTTDSSRNKRKFLLFGDPSLSLKFPKHRVFTSKINNKPVIDSASIIDTLSAMKKVKIEGFVGNQPDEILTTFNGKVYVTVFDKPQTLKTFANDHEGNEAFRKEFDVQKNILFKGLAEVTNGKFEITFILPKDINYKYGPGKISYYAIDSDLSQAAGEYKGISIGGTAKNIMVDNEGPDIQLFMNDKGFAYGGITNSEPILLGFLEDESGINISTFSIGHELSGSLDKNNEDKLPLYEFYKSELNSYQKGSFDYPLSKLSTGKHLIKVQAWDVFNNKSEKIIEFVVVDKSEKTLSNVLNYPNPFSTNTTFRFEHDLPDNNLDIVINIFTLSGKLVKTIQHNTISPGFNVSDIEWNAKDDFGTRLGNGVYIYKIKVFSTEYNITRESKFEKLVILK